jgi:hypothetical protein
VPTQCRHKERPAELGERVQLGAHGASIGGEHIYKLLDIELFAHDDTRGVVDEHVPVVLPFTDALDSEATRLRTALDSGLAGKCGDEVFSLKLGGSAPLSS